MLLSLRLGPRFLPGSVFIIKKKKMTCTMSGFFSCLFFCFLFFSEIESIFRHRSQKTGCVFSASHSGWSPKTTGVSRAEVAGLSPADLAPGSGLPAHDCTVTVWATVRLANHATLCRGVAVSGEQGENSFLAPAGEQLCPGAQGGRAVSLFNLVRATANIIPIHTNV